MKVRRDWVEYDAISNIAKLSKQSLKLLKGNELSIKQNKQRSSGGFIERLGGVKVSAPVEKSEYRKEKPFYPISAPEYYLSRKSNFMLPVMAKQSLIDEPLSEKRPKSFDIAHWLYKNTILRFYREKVFFYDKRRGVYVMLNVDSEERGNSFSAFLYDKLPEQFLPSLSQSVVKSVYYILQSHRNFCPELEVVNFPNLVNLRNGLFDIVSGTFKNHDESSAMTVQLNANFISEPVLSKKLQDFFLHLAATEANLWSLFGAIGIALSNYFDLQVGIFIEGEPRNGKSTLLNFLEDIFPEEYLTALSSLDLANAFAPANLKFARLSISKDEPNVPWREESISMFKMCCGQDSIEVQKKGVQHEKIRPACHFIFAGNNPPIFPLGIYDEVARNAMKRRIWYIKTGNSIPPDKVNTEIKNWLKFEKDSVVSIALLAAHNYVSRKSLIPPCPDEIFVGMGSKTVKSKSIADFVRLTLKQTEQGTDILPISELCNQFNDFVDLDEKNFMKTNAFSRELAKIVGKENIIKKAALNRSCLCGYVYKEGKKQCMKNNYIQ